MFAFTDRNGFARAKVVAQDLREQLPAAADFRRESLADLPPYYPAKYLARYSLRYHPDIGTGAG